MLENSKEQAVSLNCFVFTPIAIATISLLANLRKIDTPCKFHSMTLLHALHPSTTSHIHKSLNSPATFSWDGLDANSFPDGNF